MILLTNLINRNLSILKKESFSPETGLNNQEQMAFVIANELGKNGYTDNGISGILANMAVESDGLDPTRLAYTGEGAYGLCQWLGGRKTAMERFTSNYIQNNGLDASNPYDLARAQTAFVVEELNNTPEYSYLNGLLKNPDTDFQTATNMFENIFEAPQVITNGRGYDEKATTAIDSLSSATAKLATSDLKSKIASGQITTTKDLIKYKNDLKLPDEIKENLFNDLYADDDVQAIIKASNTNNRRVERTDALKQRMEDVVNQEYKEQDERLSDNGKPTTETSTTKRVERTDALKQRMEDAVNQEYKEQAERLSDNGKNTTESSTTKRVERTDTLKQRMEDAVNQEYKEQAERLSDSGKPTTETSTTKRVERTDALKQRMEDVVNQEYKEQAERLSDNGKNTTETSTTKRVERTDTLKQRMEDAVNQEYKEQTERLSDNGKPTTESSTTKRVERTDALKQRMEDVVNQEYKEQAERLSDSGKNIITQKKDYIPSESIMKDNDGNILFAYNKDGKIIRDSNGNFLTYGYTESGDRGYYDPVTKRTYAYYSATEGYSDFAPGTFETTNYNNSPNGNEQVQAAIPAYQKDPIWIQTHDKYGTYRPENTQIIGQYENIGGQYIPLGYTESGATGYYDPETKRTYAYYSATEGYSDFAPGTFDFSQPYSNPFTKESIDALPESTRNELLNRNDAVGDMIRSTYYGSTNSQTTNNPINFNTSKTYSSTAQMIASDASAQGTFKMMKNMPESQRIMALNTLSSDFREAYELWESRQNASSMTVNTKTNNTSVVNNTIKPTFVSNKQEVNNINSNVKNNKKINNSGEIVKIDNFMMNELTRRISLAVQSLETIVNEIRNTDIARINNSWAAKEAEAYVEKVNKGSIKVEKVIDALNILKNAFIKTLSENESASEFVTNTIRNI